MKVHDLMSTDLEVVRPDTSYQQVVERMLARNVSGLPVVDDHGVLVGIVTEADAIRKQKAHPRHRQRIDSNPSSRPNPSHPHRRARLH